MECRFCDLEKKQAHRIVAAFKHCVVIFSNPRLMPGHLLVIPKRHTLGLNELSEEERNELFNVAVEFQSKILEKLASGCDIRQHNRPFLPESELKVDHVHIHLQPREFEDELYQKSYIHDKEVFKPLTEKEKVSILDSLM